MINERVHIVEHPVLKHYLTVMRDKTTGMARFNEAGEIVSSYILDEATKDLRLRPKPIETPLEPTIGYELDDIVTAGLIYRASLTMLPAFRKKFPDSEVPTLDITRNEQTARPMIGRCKLTEGMKDSIVIVMDPMIATAGTMVEAVAEVQTMHPKRIKVVSIVAVPEGIDEFQKSFPNIDIYLAAIDRELDERFYIKPGLGDAGDRSFGKVSDVRPLP